MAEADFVEEALSNSVDDAAVSAMVGSLEHQLQAPQQQQQPQPQQQQQQPLVIKAAPQHVQILSVRPPQVANNSKSVAAVSPRVVIGSPQIVTTARPAGPGITLQTLQSFQPGHQGHLLLKSENGQYQILRLGPPQPNPTQPNAAQPIRLTAVAPPPPRPLPPNGNRPPLVASTPTPAPTPAPAPLTPKASMDNLKEKCRKFLSNLLDLSSREPKSVERNVRILIQELIDMRVEPEAFCARLEKLLNASPQPCLIGFLKKTLPILRQSLLNKELVIEGIHAPPPGVVGGVPKPAPIAQHQPQQQQQQHHAPPPSRPVVQQQPKPVQTFKPAPAPRERDRKATAASSSSAAASSSSYDADKMAGDDDINDVAAMGGVNLAEESQKILGSTDAIGAQIRSCKDEYLAAMGPLQTRLRRIAAEHGLDEPGFDVAALLSHAVHERLKNLVEKLACVAEHRTDAVKIHPGYEVTQDVKGQLKFLEDLDRVERKKREDFEREILLRAAKSRSKTEDPEQAKLKEKAKEMQRAEMEEMRQREANLTALQAIGPRKKARTGAGPNDAADASAVSAAATAAETALGSKNGVNRSQPQPLRARMKRVNFRDLLFLLEQEKETARSVFLYKCYLK